MDLPCYRTQAGIQNRNIKVKFRFENYYSKNNWPHNNLNRWTDNASTQRAYDLLSTKYPCLWNPETVFDVSDTVRILREKGKRRLVIAPISQAVTSLISDEKF